MLPLNKESRKPIEALTGTAAQSSFELFPRDPSSITWNVTRLRIRYHPAHVPPHSSRTLAIPKPTSPILKYTVGMLDRLLEFHSCLCVRVLEPVTKKTETCHHLVFGRIPSYQILHITLSSRKQPPARPVFSLFI